VLYVPLLAFLVLARPYLAPQLTCQPEQYFTGVNMNYDAAINPTPTLPPILVVLRLQPHKERTSIPCLRRKYLSAVS
jgi:hypothetical protein